MAFDKPERFFPIPPSSGESFAIKESQLLFFQLSPGTPISKNKARKSSGVWQAAILFGHDFGGSVLPSIQATKRRWLLLNRWSWVIAFAKAERLLPTPPSSGSRLECSQSQVVDRHLSPGIPSSKNN